MQYSIKSLFGYLADEEDCKDITQKITVSRPSGSGRVTHLDADQIDKLLAACSDPRELAVISVFLDAGVRVAEAAQLKVADVLVDWPGDAGRMTSDLLSMNELHKGVYKLKNAVALS